MVRSTAASRRAVPRSILATALAVGVAAGTALAVPAAASAEPAATWVRVTHVHDGAVVDDGAAMVVPVTYWCAYGAQASFEITVTQAQGLGHARGRTVQEVECTGQAAHVDVRIDASSELRYVNGVTAIAEAWDGDYWTVRRFVPS